MTHRKVAIGAAFLAGLLVGVAMGTAAREPQPPVVPEASAAERRQLWQSHQDGHGRVVVEREHRAVANGLMPPRLQRLVEQSVLVGGEEEP
jgi:hypothetical protein